MTNSRDTLAYVPLPIDRLDLEALSNRELVILALEAMRAITPHDPELLRLKNANLSALHQTLSLFD